jgi:hypothetical protein
MFPADGGRIVMVNSASGHYQPDPKQEMDSETCEEKTTSYLSLEVFRHKLDDLGLDTVDIELLPFRHPNLVQQTMDCHGRRSQRGGGLSVSTMGMGWARGNDRAQ